jgi:hypothetical protein
LAGTSGFRVVVLLEGLADGAAPPLDTVEPIVESTLGDERAAR